MNHMFIFEYVQVKQKGLIGITINSHWFVPYSDSKQDQAAALRALDFMFGWYEQTGYYI